MTIFNFLLVIHVVGAIFTGASVLGSVLAIVKKQQDKYASQARQLAVAGMFQIVSGILVAITSQSATAVGTCIKLGMYLVVVVGTEILLGYAQAKRLKIARSE